MTHFVGAVIVPKHIGIRLATREVELYAGLTRPKTSPIGDDRQALDDHLNAALEKFNENREVEPYIEDSEWEKALAEAKKSHREHAGQALPWNSGETWPTLETIENWTDQQYLDAWSGEGAWKPREMQPGFDSFSTYNPDSKWDWWVIGGRWTEVYGARQGETVKDFQQAIAEKLAALADPEQVAITAAAQVEYDAAQKAYYAAAMDDAVRAALDAAWEKLSATPAHVGWAYPYAIVTSLGTEHTPVDDELVYDEDGQPVITLTHEWVEKGQMGWWGAHTDAHDNVGWLQAMAEVLGKHDAEDRVIYIDFHI